MKKRMACGRRRVGFLRRVSPGGRELFRFRTTRDGVHNYTYDDLNQLIEALNPLPANSQETYVCDPACSAMGSLWRLG
jgi:YD repeat-containing protein